MTANSGIRWTGPEAEDTADHRAISLERQLALVDRIIGLEAQVAQLAVTDSLTPTEQLRAEKQLSRLRATPAWRIGRILTSPARIARRVLKRR